MPFRRRFPNNPTSGGLEMKNDKNPGRRRFLKHMGVAAAMAMDGTGAAMAVPRKKLQTPNTVQKNLHHE
jgi:hypothetical protein